MSLWKLTCRLLAAVGSGRMFATDGALAPAGGSQRAGVAGAMIQTGPGWLLWPGIVAVALAAAGLLIWWRRRAGRIAMPPDRGFSLTEERYRRLFDRTPVQILEEDFTGLLERFARLRAEGVTDMITHLAAHPGLPREWLGRVRLIDANRPAVAAAGFTDRQEMIARFPQHAATPYLEVFQCQLGAVWAGRRLFQEEFRYLDAGGHERACLMQCQLEERDAQLDFSRVLLVLIDITASKRAASAQIEDQDLMSRILARADILLWWAQVRRENGRLVWKLNVPEQSSDTPLLKLATARDRNGLWESERAPDFDEITVRSTEAILSGSPGYQQEFRVLSAEGATRWMDEKVGISRLGPDEWSLVGVVMDATARHEAEEERRKSQAQLKEILTRADCLLWHANVLRGGDGLRWRNFAMPGSVLCDRLFGEKPPATGSGLWFDVDTQDLAEMNRRSTAAILSGAPGYEQEFSILRPQRTFWLHEQVSITPVGPDQWDLVGVLMDVTARHEAEEARKASEAQLKQLLDRADCMVWQAQVTENVSEGMGWLLFIPHSNLYRELFGGDPSEHPNLMWNELNVPELPGMNARATAAIHDGLPGYEQEFRAQPAGRRYVLREQVSITPVAPGRWSLVGVITDITAARQAEEAIRASETRYRDLFEGAVEGVFQSTPDGRFVSVNPSLARIFGCATPAEFLALTEGGAKSLYVRPGRREEFFSELGARDSVTDFESEVYCRDGSVRWISEDVRAVRDADGRLLHMQGFLSDVTERHKALIAVQESESRYRELFENIPIAILELDLRNLGRTLRRWHAAGVRELVPHLAAHPGEFAALSASIGMAAVNETAVRLFKAETKAHLQNEISRLFTAPVIGVMQRWLEAVWQGRNDGEAEADVDDFVGGCHHTYVRWWMPRQAEWLQLERAVVALVDLTELKRAEAALAAEKERLAVTLRAMSEGVITTDTLGIVQFINRAAAELTQCDAATAMGRPLAEICVLRGQRSDEAVVLPLAQVLEERAPVNLPPDTRLAGRDGATCLVEGCCAPVHDAQSEIIGTVLVIRDVTVRQRFEEELERASRLESIGILAGGIAHDFNNILTAIMGNIALALLDAGGLATVERYLGEAERATLRARDLTQQLLTFAKGGDPVRAAVSLPEIIREVTEFALHGSRVKCAFDLSPELWPADADKGQLEQVVQNLVINAVQSMPEGGSIRIGAANEIVGPDSQRPFFPGDYVHISVADTGTGIKPEHLARIFDPYFTTKQHGSGLGLTTVYSIIRKHKGHIEVESELGRGTTFHLWLPALREQQMEMPEDRCEAVALMGGRVLFMDDEEPILAMAEMLLRRLGLEVELARDGAEAIRKYSEAHAAGRPFDLVVMDLTVPGGVGGREAIKQLRRIDPNVRAIVSSGYSSDPVLANHRAYGFRGMVAKPFKIADFAQVLRAVLRESRSPLPGGSRPPLEDATTPPPAPPR